MLQEKAEAEVDEDSLNWKNQLSSNRLKKFVSCNPVPVSLVFIGIILIGYGAFLVKDGVFPSSSKIEILETKTEGERPNSYLVVEVAGAVERPGVYRLERGKRVDDVLLAAGGITPDADRQWLEKTLNKAAKISDGQKIYIPSKEEIEKITSQQSGILSANDYGGYQNSSLIFFDQTEEKVNINSATSLELEKLWGIGRITAQKIIDHRPYSTVEELLEKKILKRNVYDRNKDKFSIY